MKKAVKKSKFKSTIGVRRTDRPVTLDSLCKSSNIVLEKSVDSDLNAKLVLEHGVLLSKFGDLFTKRNFFISEIGKFRSKRDIKRDKRDALLESIRILKTGIPSLRKEIGFLKGQLAILRKGS